MKESERIQIEMQNDNDDNDWRDANYLRKIERAKRKESFEDYILPLLQRKFEVTIKDNEYTIFTYKYGRLIYYPKANSLLIARDNYWIKGYGVKWIQKYLINVV